MKSSYSNSQGNCVEVDRISSLKTIVITNTNDPMLKTLWISIGSFRKLVEDIKANRVGDGHVPH